MIHDVMKRKILIYTPGGVGGAERMSLLIGKILPKDKFDVKIVVLGRLRGIYNIMPGDIDVDCIPVRNIYAFSTFRIWRNIRKEKPDVVFVSLSSYNPRVIVASKLAGRRVIVRSSGMISTYPWFKLLQVRLTYPMADKLIAQQEEMRQEMIRILKVLPDKVITLHNPVDTQDIERLSTACSPYPEDGSVNYVYVARIIPSKAHDVAIKSMARVKKAIPDAHLYFVGGYDENSEYYINIVKLISDLQLQSCIHFIGYDKNPFRWVKNSDCFVFPSRIEGLPNSLIEASYLGVPCVAARCLNIVDDIIENGQNGFVVDVDDIDGFSQAMIDAVRIKECKMVYTPSCAEDYSLLFDNVGQYC